MDYFAHYERLMTRAANRQLSKDVYTEKHHIYPRCFRKRENNTQVRLIPEEHYVAHQLLVKMFPEDNRLKFALRKMIVGLRRNNKLYGWIRRMYSEAVVKQWEDPEHRQYMHDCAVIQMSAFWNDNEQCAKRRENIRNAAIKLWESAEFRKERSELVSKQMNSQWKNSEWASKRLERLQSSEFADSKSDLLKKKWDNKDWRIKQTQLIQDGRKKASAERKTNPAGYYEKQLQKYRVKLDRLSIRSLTVNSEYVQNQITEVMSKINMLADKLAKILKIDLSSD